MKIIRNKIQCRKCDDVIESLDRHDFRACRCGAVCVDGGFDYLRRCGDPKDIIDLSEVEREKNEGQGI